MSDGISRFAGFRLLAGGVAFVAYYARGLSALLTTLVIMLAIETASLHRRLEKVGDGDYDE